MDNLRWLREYDPRADETLKARGDTKPLKNQHVNVADELGQLRELIDLAIVYETTLPADWVSCARQLRAKQKV